MKIILIDDEEPARNLVKTWLAGRQDIKVVAECGNGFEGLKAIQELKPDLVFLDIQMPKITGFEMLELLDEKPNIIFATAYNEYAIKAFEQNAVDYLLKPFSKERFEAALNKAIQRLGKDGAEEKVNALAEYTKEHNHTLERVVVKTGTRINIIPVEKIQYIEAQDDYVMIYTDEGKFLKQNTMKFFEDHLPENDFVRIHRSHIVSINQIHKLELYDKDSYVVVLKNNVKLQVSKGGYSRLKQVLNF